MTFIARLMEVRAAIEQAGSWRLMAWLAAAACVVMAGVLVRQTRNARQLKREVAALRGGALAGDSVELDQSTVLTGMSLAPIDRVLPRDPRRFLALVATVAVGCWLVGLMLAPNVRRFLTSPEWLFQPFYIAAHFITLRMFINVYTRNFAAGVRHLRKGTAMSNSAVPC